MLAQYEVDLTSLLLGKLSYFNLDGKLTESGTKNSSITNFAAEMYMFSECLQIYAIPVGQFCCNEVFCASFIKTFNQEKHILGWKYFSFVDQTAVINKLHERSGMVFSLFKLLSTSWPKRFLSE